LRFEVVDNANYNILYGNDAGSNLDGGISNICIGEIAGNKLTTGNDNVFIGRSAGYRAINSDGNTMISRRAGYENENDFNTFIGFEAGTFSDSSNVSVHIGAKAGARSEGDDNIFIGYLSGERNDQGGDENVAIGNYTLQQSGNNKAATADSKYNVAVGHNAGKANDKGYNNVFIGKDAGLLNDGGNNNTFLGYTAGNDTDEGIFNTFLDGYAGNISGDYNIAVGSESGSGSNGSENVFLGEDSGKFNDGSGNVFIGNEAGWNVPGGPIQNVRNTLVISNNRDENLIYGEFDDGFIRVTGSDAWQMELDNPDPGGSVWKIGSSDDDWIIGGGKFSINNVGNASNSPFVIDANGNVGIGDVTPTVKLDVDGIIRGPQLICGNVAQCSDVRFKKDFKSIDNL